MKRSRLDPAAGLTSARTGAQPRPEPVGHVRDGTAGATLLQLQRRYGNRYVQDVIGRSRSLEEVHRTIQARRHAGRPLDPAVSDRLGQALSADLSQVRVHADQTADSLTRSLHADAFTAGSHIFFRATRYDPGTAAGRHLLAHELAHVIQQSPAGRPESGLRVGPAGDPHEREADRVAADVVSGTPARPSAVPGPPPSIQRQVYVGNTHIQQLPGGVDAGDGKRKVSVMIADKPARYYFNSEQELYNYAAEKTETIGYVDKEKAWVRLNGKELLVLGEIHAETTLLDVANAVGTKRYRYEKYSTVPAWVSEKYLGASASKGGAWEDLVARVKAGAGHEAEDFFPKLWRGLAGFIYGLDPKREQKISEDEWKLFWHAVYVGSMADEKTEEEVTGLSKAFRKGKEKVFESFLKTSYAELSDWVKKTDWKTVRTAAKAISDPIIVHVVNSMRFAADYERFEKSWQKLEKDYSDADVLQADRARDFSMFQHIVQAATDETLLFGMGNIHLERLRKLLEDMAREFHVRYLKMDDFIHEQQRQYPQDK